MWPRESRCYVGTEDDTDPDIPRPHWELLTALAVEKSKHKHFRAAATPYYNTEQLRGY